MLSNDRAQRTTANAEVVSLALVSCLLAGCAGSTKGSTTIDVHGVVVSDMGVPVAGAVVGVPGVGTTSTAADGSFMLAGVTPPYDIGVSMPSSGVAVFYQSVRSATVRVPLLDSPHVKQIGYVTGTITGGESYPQLANHATQVCLEAATNFAQSPSAVSSTGAYTAELAWGDTATIDATLHGMQTILDPATGQPIHYTAYGRVYGLTVAAGGANANQQLDLSGTTIGQATLTGTVILPGGYTLLGKSLHWKCLDLVEDGGAGTSFSYATPDILGAKLTLEIRAHSGAAEATTRMSGLAPGATGVSVAVSPAPVQASPAANATGVDASTAVFSWSGSTQGQAAAAPQAGAGAVYVFSLQDAAAYPTLTPVLIVITPQTSTKIPDPALVGVSVPRGAVLAWDVGTITPETMEDIVARGTVVPAWPLVSETRSETRLLTTAP